MKFLFCCLLLLFVIVNSKTTAVIINSANPPSAGDPATGGGSTNNCDKEKQKSKFASILLCVFVPYFAVHRFYLGYIGLVKKKKKKNSNQTLKGILWIVLGLLTGGISTFIWMIIDVILIGTDALPDASGCPLK